MRVAQTGERRHLVQTDLTLQRVFHEVQDRLEPRRSDVCGEFGRNRFGRTGSEHLDDQHRRQRLGVGDGETLRRSAQGCEALHQTRRHGVRAALRTQIEVADPLPEHASKRGMLDLADQGSLRSAAGDFRGVSSPSGQHRAGSGAVRDPRTAAHRIPGLLHHEFAVAFQHEDEGVVR
jgi:hypothetical protein